jgi:hypothetical protein
MLYESTKSLLQSIVQSLETGDQTRWDDRTESGNACLYEMHQMCKPLYKAYKFDSLNADLAGPSTIPESLNRAIPHVRTMVIAIRHKDQTPAIASGRAALAALNCASHSRVSGKNRETRKPSGGYGGMKSQLESIVRRFEAPPSGRLAIQSRTYNPPASKHVRAVTRRHTEAESGLVHPGEGGVRTKGRPFGHCLWQTGSSGHVENPDRELQTAFCR